MLLDLLYPFLELWGSEFNVATMRKVVSIRCLTSKTAYINAVVQSQRAMQLKWIGFYEV
jgi:hypothetical protein